MIETRLHRRLLLLAFIFSFFFSCKDREIEKKIDPDLRLKLKNIKEASQLDKNVSVVFKVNEPLTDLHRKILSDNQIKIIANIGHIYTATLPAKKIVALARMRFVDYVQGSKVFRAHPQDSTTQIENVKE